MRKLLPLLIILLFLIFLLQLNLSGQITGNVVSKYDHMQNFECTKDFAGSDMLKYKHTEVDYNTMRLCCEKLGGYWYDITSRDDIKCSSWYYCSGRHNPRKPWAHCVFLE